LIGQTVLDASPDARRLGHAAAWTFPDPRFPQPDDTGCRTPEILSVTAGVYRLSRSRTRSKSRVCSSINLSIQPRSIRT
jgi:hypothetical protein